MRISLPDPVRGDLKQFFDKVTQHPVDLRTLGVPNISFEQMLATLHKVYQID